MTTAVVTYEHMERMARSLVKSGMLGLQNVDQALTLMALAQAEGKPLITIARDYNVIEGRPAKKSEAMLRDFAAGGGKVEWHKLTDDIADATFAHPSGGTIRITWDIPRAQKAGLVQRKGEMYLKYPRRMLSARCISEGVRTVGPFATGGMYTPEEVADMGDTLPPMRDVTPQVVDHHLDPGVVLDHCAAIEGASDLADLKYWYGNAYKAAKEAGDASAMEQFERKKNARKQDLVAEDSL